MEYFPIFLNIRNKIVLVTGEFNVLEFKISKLLEAGARVRYVSKLMLPGLSGYSNSENFHFIRDDLNEKYLKDVWLVFCGSHDKKLKQNLSKWAEKYRVLCNFVDEPVISTFISPSVLSKGDISIAISTRGKSPALNRLLKSKIDQNIGVEYEYLAEIMGNIRNTVITHIANLKKRTELFDSIVANKEVLDLLKNQNRIEAENLVNQIVQDYILLNKSN